MWSTRETFRVVVQELTGEEWPPKWYGSTTQDFAEWNHEMTIYLIATLSQETTVPTKRAIV